ncbi:MAG: SDR family oxidoreductase [Bacteroidetes bacterium]|nr:SDR family oxidoreductase [Bacteroidota bacterium]
MRTLVTGGCGFIGSHIAEALLMRGDEVIIIDNLSTGRLLNIEHLRSNPNLTFVECDISDHEQIEPWFKNIDWVFHIAALADIVPSIQMPLLYHNSNVNGTISVLEAARKHDVKRFIYAASSSCYGIPDAYPTLESAEIRPQYPYATTKYLGEQYVMNWHYIYELPVTSMRFFNVYGTRSRTSGTYGAVFGVFLAQKLNKKPFTVVGNGTQTRDFTYVSDIANACITAAEHPDAAGEIMNVGSGNTYSINRLVELLGGEVTYIPKRPGEPDCTFADISKIRKLLNWEPKVSFEKGVQKMIDQIDYWREAPLWDQLSIAEATKDWFKYLGK